MRRGELLRELERGGMPERLAPIYGREAPAAAARLRELILEFAETFPCTDDSDTWLFSTPGRTELGGNHTDHQRGRGLAGSVNLDTIACVVPNNSRTIRIKSRHHRLAEVKLDQLSLQGAETGSSPALVRGVAARLTELGHTIGGFDAYTTTSVLRGSGLSSSAAFEVLTGTMLNGLFWGGRASAVEIAQIGQYAENVFFGKPCGLMDQTASSVGGVVAIDFADPSRPVVEQISLDLAAGGYALCIIDSGADHADLTDEYAAVTRELKAVCRHFGKEVLREVPEEDFLANLPKVRAASGDRGTLRALHVYGENRRAAQEAQALREGDIPRFLHLVRESGRSSALYLQNVVPTGQREKQELLLTIALAERLLEGEGAVRVHGGGFGGTAQAFVPLKKLPAFQAGIEAVLGEGSCHVLSIRPVGGVRIG